MFQQSDTRSRGNSAATLLELVYHGIVRSVRKAHGNPLMSILVNVLQTVVFVLAFYFMFTVLGLRGLKIRGDFLIFIMTGIFLFMTHVKALGAVLASEGPASPIMQHAPMNTAVAILSAALGSLYIQLLSAFLVLFVYHVVFTPVEFHDPVGVLGMFLLAWFTGAAIGLVLLAVKPWFPTFVSIFAMVYQRANMIASGKMFVANMMPGYMLVMFDWNPLFHAIDQSRGFAFANYFPRNSSIEYPLTVGLVLVMIGLMGEYFTRKHASASWYARR
ncbi:MAG: ABC-type polysaccharide/polyol phosphate export permease [Rhodobacteraceae bacterium HLUCCA24]|nr:MAG: ABC-type polysaccharide/polyol phosphate export permease [Rhodobacteraceae bacterium HLUCCA24]